MRRYRSRLETVARLRAIEERSALAQLARRRQESAVAADAADAARARFAEACTPPPATTVADLGLQRQVAGWRAAGARDADERSAASAGQVDDALAAYQQAQRRLRILERLDERRREEHRLEAERVERLEADQLVADRWSRRRGA